MRPEEAAPPAQQDAAARQCAAAASAALTTAVSAPAALPTTSAAAASPPAAGAAAGAGGFAFAMAAACLTPAPLGKPVRPQASGAGGAGNPAAKRLLANMQAGSGADAKRKPQVSPAAAATPQPAAGQQNGGRQQQLPPLNAVAFSTPNAGPPLSPTDAPPFSPLTASPGTPMELRAASAALLTVSKMNHYEPPCDHLSQASYQELQGGPCLPCPIGHSCCSSTPGSRRTVSSRAVNIFDTRGAVAIGFFPAALCEAFLTHGVATLQAAAGGKPGATHSPSAAPLQYLEALLRRLGHLDREGYFESPVDEEEAPG